MTGRILIGGRRAGREFAAMLAASQTEAGRIAINAAIKAEREKVRSTLLADADHGLEPGQTIQFGGEIYRVAMPGPVINQVMIEKMTQPAVKVDKRGAQKFGGDRPYLKKKKGRS